MHPPHQRQHRCALLTLHDDGPIRKVGLDAARHPCSFVVNLDGPALAVPVEHALSARGAGVPRARDLTVENETATDLGGVVKGGHTFALEVKVVGCNNTIFVVLARLALQAKQEHVELPFFACGAPGPAGARTPCSSDWPVECVCREVTNIM